MPLRTSHPCTHHGTMISFLRCGIALALATLPLPPEAPPCEQQEGGMGIQQLSTQHGCLPYSVRVGAGIPLSFPILRACFTCLAAAAFSLPLAAFFAACLACTCRKRGGR